MDLTTWMEESGESLQGLAQRADVTWRTARKAAQRQLESASTARRIAEAIGRDGQGEYVVDPASMLALDPPAQGPLEATGTEGF